LTSGKYRQALADFLDHERTASALRHRLWLTISYPLMLLAVIAIWFLFILFVLVPPFDAIFKDFKVALPSLTITLVRVAHARMLLLIVAVLLALGVAVAARFASRL